MAASSINPCGLPGSGASAADWQLTYRGLAVGAIGAPQSWGPGLMSPPASMTLDEYVCAVQAGLTAGPWADAQIADVQAGLAVVEKCWPCTGQGGASGGPTATVAPGTGQLGPNCITDPVAAARQICQMQQEAATLKASGLTYNPPYSAACISAMNTAAAQYTATPEGSQYACGIFP